MGHAGRASATDNAVKKEGTGIVTIAAVPTGSQDVARRRRTLRPSVAGENSGGIGRAMGGRIRFFQAGMFDIEPRRRQRIRQGLKAFEQEFIRVAHADNFDFSKQACSTTSRVYRSDARNTLLQSGAQAHNIGPM